MRSGRHQRGGYHEEGGRHERRWVSRGVGVKRLGAISKGGYCEEGGPHGPHSLLHTPQSSWLNARPVQGALCCRGSEPHSEDVGPAPTL